MSGLPSSRELSCSSGDIMSLFALVKVSISLGRDCHLPGLPVYRRQRLVQLLRSPDWCSVRLRGIGYSLCARALDNDQLPTGTAIDQRLPRESPVIESQTSTSVLRLQALPSGVQKSEGHCHTVLDAYCHRRTDYTAKPPLADAPRTPAIGTPRTNDANPATTRCYASVALPATSMAIPHGERNQAPPDVLTRRPEPNSRRRPCLPVTNPDSRSARTP